MAIIPLHSQHQVSNARRSAAHTSLNEAPTPPAGGNERSQTRPGKHKRIASRGTTVGTQPALLLCPYSVPFLLALPTLRGNSTLAHKYVSDRCYSLLQSTMFFSLGSLLRCPRSSQRLQAGRASLGQQRSAPTNPIWPIASVLTESDHHRTCELHQPPHLCTPELDLLSSKAQPWQSCPFQTKVARYFLRSINECNVTDEG